MVTGYAVPSRVLCGINIIIPTARGRRCLSPFFNSP
jgi:hypothetical protein